VVLRDVGLAKQVAQQTNVKSMRIKKNKGPEVEFGNLLIPQNHTSPPVAHHDLETQRIHPVCTLSALSNKEHHIIITAARHHPKKL
jgi:hypothetical protein